MKKLFAFAFGILVYGFFLGTFLYTMGFVANVVVPKSIDSGAATPLIGAVVGNLLLLMVFAVQHSVMARPGFKRWWTRIVPESVERSVYVLAASAALALMCWQWRPIASPIVWSVQQSIGVVALHALCVMGWATVLVSTFLINHFELFGLHQVYANLVGRALPTIQFKTPLFYRHVRHPIYLGFMLAIWATPTMSMGHLMFAMATTGYIFIGIYFEERDLIARFGERYLRYRKDVSMIVPVPAMLRNTSAIDKVNTGANP